MINNLYIKATPTTATVTWGSITGTLSDQTDLQSALNAKQATLVSGTTIKTLEGQSLLGSGNIDLTKSDVGLANVDNTSDLNKPISTATQTALNAKQDTLTLTTTGTSGAATLVGSTLNIPQYSGGGSANPSVIAASYVDGTTVTGTTTNTISQSLLIPANSFTGNGVLEVLCRVFKTGNNGTLTFRIYNNTINSLTGATLIATCLNNAAAQNTQGVAIRSMRVNSNTLTTYPVGTASLSDYFLGVGSFATATFLTSVDNYIIISIQLGSALDSALINMCRATKYI